MNILQTEDTICAIATAQGGAIGTIRVSGPEAITLTDRIFKPVSGKSLAERAPYTLTFGHILTPEGEIIDEVLVSLFRAPHSYTGQDSTEISCHGSSYILQQVMQLLIRQGCRAAGPGEYTQRAFLNGKMDLSQAEAVAELVAAPSREAVRFGLSRLEGLLGRRVRALRTELDGLRAQMCLAVDFPEEEVESLPPSAFAGRVLDVMQALEGLLRAQRRARVMQQGAQVVLAGAVNAGKSSLMNALLGRQRALVTDIPGTTRDFIEEGCDLDGLPIRLVDTAGLREATESVEHLGIALSREKLAQADAILLVVDGGALGEDGAAAVVCPEPAAAEVLETAGDIPVLLVWNKADLCDPAVFPPRWAGRRPALRLCARSGAGLDELAARLRECILAGTAETPPEDGLAPNARQALALEQARRELEGLHADILSGMPYDCCAVRLAAATAYLDEVTGSNSTEEVLNSIFEHFCIGK